MSKEKKTDVTASKKERSIQHVDPASMFSPFGEMERWFEGAFPTLRQRYFRGGWPSWGEMPAVHLPARWPYPVKLIPPR